MQAFPVRRNGLLQAGHDHFDDVAPHQGYPFTQERDRAVLHADLFSEALDLGRTRDERREIEAEDRFDLILPPSHEAFAVGRIASDDEACIDEAGEMAAQGRWRHAVRTDGELLVRGKDDKGRAGVPRQSERGLRVAT